MSLPLKAIDRLFERLAHTYGNEWIAQWAGQDEAKVKTIWAYELSGFTIRLEAIAWALENLPTRAPNAIMFKQLCRQAPRPPEQQLPAPKADPERMKAELSKLRTSSTHKTSTGGVDHKAWAKRLVAMHEAGDKVRPISLRFAREALRMNVMGEAA